MFKVFTGGKFGTAVAVAALAMTFGTTANAASYGNIADPFGVYFGGGNVNGNFTIGNSNGIELALRAKTYRGATIDGSGGVYQANTGLSPNRTPTETPRLDWNYEFSINTSGSQSALSDFVFRLGVDNDPTSGVNFSFVNPVTYFGDSPTRTIPNTDLIAGTQNSENGIFLNTPGGQINPFIAGLYSFELAAYSLTDTAFSSALAISDILVRVGNPASTNVPEPASMALLALGAAGLFAARRRKA